MDSLIEMIVTREKQTDLLSSLHLRNYLKSTRKLKQSEEYKIAQDLVIIKQIISEDFGLNKQLFKKTLGEILKSSLIKQERAIIGLIDTKCVELGNEKVLLVEIVEKHWNYVTAIFIAELLIRKANEERKILIFEWVKSIMITIISGAAIIIASIMKDIILPNQ